MIFTPAPNLAIWLGIIGIADIFIGLLLVYKYRTQVHILSSLLSIFFGLWTIFVGVMAAGISIPLGYKYAAWAGAPLPVLLLFLSLIFPDKKLPWSTIRLFLFSLPALLFMVVAPTDIWIKTETIGQGRIFLELAPFFINYYLSYFVVYFVWASINFFKLYEKSNILIRQQCKYFAAGLLLAGAIGIFCNIVLTYFRISKLLYFGPLGSIFFVGFTAYAILKYRLMDITIVIKKSLVYSIIVALFSAVYLFVIFLSSQCLQALTGSSSILAAALLILVFAIGFQPLRYRIESMINRVFFQEKYDYQSAVRRLAHLSTTIINLNQLLELVTKNVTDIFKVNEFSVYLLESDERSYGLRKM